MRQRRNRIDFLRGEGKRRSPRIGFILPQMRKGVVVMPGAVADAVTEAVERRQGHQHDVGNNFGRRWRGLEDAERPEHQPVARRPGAKAQRLAARGNRRQRQPRTACCKLSHQWHGIDLAADRRIAGEDAPSRDRKRQAALGKRFRRRRALRRTQRIACREGRGAEVGFDWRCRQGCHPASHSAVVTREGG